MNAMTEMENTVINMTGCNRETANLVANAILDIDRKTNTEANENINEYHPCPDCVWYGIRCNHKRGCQTEMYEFFDPKM